MRIRFFGFVLEIEEGVAVSGFLERLSEQTEEIEFRKQNRILRLSQRGDYWRGIVLTIRDQRSIHELMRGRRGPTIERREIGEDGLLEFNFFVVNPDSGYGLYQEYHHSMGLTTFGSFLRSFYASYRRDLREADPDSRFSRSLSFSPIVREEDFDSLLDRMAVIKKMRFRVSTVVDQPGVFTPLAGTARTITHEVSFRRTLNVQNIVRAVRNTLNGAGSSVASVYGEDDDGTPLTIRLEDNLTTYGDFDFDSLIGISGIDLESIGQHPVTRALMKAMNKHGL